MPPKKILLAEDDEDDREFFRDFVRSRKDIVLIDVAKNGEEIIRSLSEISQPVNLPDVILLDQNMPKQNGLQTLEILKRNHQFQNIPVFIYSTYTDDNLKKKSEDSGARLVFAKPFTFEGYHSMVDCMLDLIEE